MLALSLMLLPACGASSANRSGALSGDPVTTTCSIASDGSRTNAAVTWDNTLNTAITQAKFKFNGLDGQLGTRTTPPGTIKFAKIITGAPSNVTVQLLDTNGAVLQTTSVNCTTAQ